MLTAGLIVDYIFEAASKGTFIVAEKALETAARKILKTVTKKSLEES